MNAKSLGNFPIHLGVGATAMVEPEFSGQMKWYEEYSTRHADDGIEGRLVSMHTFEESWDSWEMHPNGCEVVICVSGSITLHQEEINGEIYTVILKSGQYAINEPGVWHTADVYESTAAVFITSGLGTQHRHR